MQKQKNKIENHKNISGWWIMAVSLPQQQSDGILGAGFGWEEIELWGQSSAPLMTFLRWWGVGAGAGHRDALLKVSSSKYWRPGRCQKQQ